MRERFATWLLLVRALPVGIQEWTTLTNIVSRRGVVFFRNQDITSDQQKILGQKLGELTGKPDTSKVIALAVYVASGQTNQGGLAPSSCRQ